MGFTQSTHDPCLLYKKKFLVIVYVDDIGIAALQADMIDSFVDELKSCSFSLTKEGSFSKYLGIKFEKNNQDGTITLTQKGLIKKILTATELVDCNLNHHPAATTALGLDLDGPVYKKTWNYASILGMLLYLLTNTCPDISFAVRQVARFNHNLKQSHATALIMIVHYLKGTADKGMVIKPNGALDLDTWCNTDFAGLYKCDPDTHPSSVKSHCAFIIFLSNGPLFWKTQLHSEITLSTTEAEYTTLSMCLWTLLPINHLLLQVTQALDVSPSRYAALHCHIFQDNQAALQLAVTQRITNRTKYFLVKWHWFWEHVWHGPEDDGDPNYFLVITDESTHMMHADYLTKGLLNEKYEANCVLSQSW